MSCAWLPGNCYHGLHCVPVDGLGGQSFHVFRVEAVDATKRSADATVVLVWVAVMSLVGLLFGALQKDS